MSRVIAKRELLYSLKGDNIRKPLIVLIHEPKPIGEGGVNFPIHSGASVCDIEIEGLPEEFFEEVHGADSVQALSFAVDVDGYLRYLQKKYDIYWPCGDSYFDQ